MNPALQGALKKALLAGFVAAFTVFFREYALEQERLDKEAELAAQKGSY
jgi:hypothetical protein